jgi:tetratricopeptide (TPR) repeat protein
MKRLGSRTIAELSQARNDRPFLPGGETIGYGDRMSKTTAISEEMAIEIAENLLRAERYAELVDHCAKYVDHFEKSAVLWRLQGIGHGSSGEAEKARFSFLTALQIDPKDALTVANYAMSCYELGDKESANKIVQGTFGGLTFEGQTMILAMAAEAVEVGFVKLDELPPIIIDLLTLATPEGH